MQPLVTISIPLFKCEAFLEMCLDSVLLQTYSNLEIILINDQTPDKSVEIAEDFIKKHQLKNWKIYHLKENSGLSVVRNKGIDTAQGKYIFFLDSDDEILPETIQLMVDLAEKEKLEMVVGSAETVDYSTKAVSAMFNIKSKKTVLRGNQNIFSAFVADDYPTSSWNKLILLEFLLKEKLYFTPKLFAQDALQSFQTAMKLESVGFINDITYRYYLHANSVIHNRGKRNFDNWFTIGTYINEALQAEKDPQRRTLILNYFTNYKNDTLLMNWKAQKNEALWKESYRNYKKFSALKINDYFNNDLPLKIKKADFFNRLPTTLGFKLFKWRYER